MVAAVEGKKTLWHATDALATAGLFLPCMGGGSNYLWLFGDVWIG